MGFRGNAERFNCRGAIEKPTGVLHFFGFRENAGRFYCRGASKSPSIRLQREIEMAEAPSILLQRGIGIAEALRGIEIAETPSMPLQRGIEFAETPSIPLQRGAKITKPHFLNIFSQSTSRESGTVPRKAQREPNGSPRKSQGGRLVPNRRPRTLKSRFSLQRGVKITKSQKCKKKQPRGPQIDAKGSEKDPK